MFKNAWLSGEAAEMQVLVILSPTASCCRLASLGSPQRVTGTLTRRVREGDGCNGGETNFDRCRIPNPQSGARPLGEAHGHGPKLQEDSLVIGHI